MFLFSWFKHPLSRLYICLKVALCARLLRCKSLATPFCPTIRLASFYTATCWIALVLLIAKFLHCRGNEVVALQTSAILLPRLLPGFTQQPPSATHPKPFNAEETKWSPCDPLRFCNPRRTPGSRGRSCSGQKKCPRKFRGHLLNL